MANPKHTEILEKGVKFWNQWRLHNRIVIPDLSFAYFENIDLSGIDFHQAELSGISLNSAILIGADFFKANLSDTYLINANLNGAILRNSNLMNANLNGASLIKADLEGANLFFTDLSNANLTESNLFKTIFSSSIFYKTNFNRAILGNTHFGNVDISQCSGLDNINHFAPSTIGMDSFLKSGRNISHVFLNEIGIPEEIINYYPPVICKPIQFYKCFFCCSRKDNSFNLKLYNDLKENNIDCWKFSEDAKYGESIWKEIDQYIRYSDKLLLICSINSLQNNYVLREIERALLIEEKENINRLFPIRIDDYIFDKWEYPRKADVVSKVIGNFCEWDKDVDKYNKSLNKLIKALRAE